MLNPAKPRTFLKIRKRGDIFDINFSQTKDYKEYRCESFAIWAENFWMVVIEINPWSSLFLNIEKNLILKSV